MTGMKNPGLVRLNFVKLINYGGQPEVRSKYDPPLSCSGYCTACEEEGLTGTDLHLDQMSHGAFFIKRLMRFISFSS